MSDILEQLGYTPEEADKIRALPVPCESCGEDTNARKTPMRLCPYRNCVEWLCGWCGGYTGGYGPVGCPCEDYRDPYPTRVNRLDYRKRLKSRARKRRR